MNASFVAVADLIHGGGPFVLAIFVAGALLWALSLERMWFFWRVLPGEISSTLQAWHARSDRDSWCARQIRMAMISRVSVSMNAGIPILRVLVPLTPLLGLVGTVTGMLLVFDSMSLRGSADARAMAAGISQAMICTMTGLAVSITGLYPVYYFDSRARRESDRLAERMDLRDVSPTSPR